MQLVFLVFASLRCVQFNTFMYRLQCAEFTDFRFHFCFSQLQGFQQMVRFSLYMVVVDERAVDGFNRVMCALAEPELLHGLRSQRLGLLHGERDEVRKRAQKELV